MSKIGQKPVIVPQSVSVDIAEGKVTVKGAGGTLVIPMTPGITVAKEKDTLIFSRANNSKHQKSLH